MAENVSIIIKAFDKTKKSFKNVTAGLATVTGAFDGMVEASFSIQCSGAITEAQV